MNHPWLFAIAGLLATLARQVGAADAPQPAVPQIAGQIRVEPATINLNHLRRPHSIIVTASAAGTAAPQTAGGTPAPQIADSRTLDLTSQATYTSSNTAVARVTPLGWVEPVASGTAEVTVSAAGQSAIVKVNVKLPDAAAGPPKHSFRHDVMPALSKGGCNAGACHGYSLGKNGFKLSLRGADAAADVLSLSDEFFERRINRHNPEVSLLITKPLGDVPHKGGIRFDRGSLLHESLLGWIADGAPNDVADPVHVQSVRIYPEAIVVSPSMQQQLQLIAKYSDGSVRDVTRLGIYCVNTERVAEVTDEGLVTIRELGETAVVARFERIFATANFIVLEPRPGFQPTPVPQDNLIDRHVTEKLNALHITPSGQVADAKFLRRVYLDLIGIQPKPDELHAFLADAAPDKRARVVESLFRRREFVDRWSLKWGDLLQNSRTQLNAPAVYAFREWIRVAIDENMPLDDFVRKILTSRGGVSDDPTSAFFAVSKDVDDTLQRATQVFCGVRMLCAKCHPHPHENWTQVDYYGLQSFFNQVGVKGDPRLPGVQNAKAVILNLPAGFARNPRSGQLQPPRYLGGGEVEIAPGSDRRLVYAKWLTSPENPFFAKSMANRIWSYFFHRGIIDPVDDLRTTNPPINPALLDALTKEFADHKFDVRHLMRTIVNSRTYQRDSATNETNAHDDANFSHFVPRRLPAESLLDSLVQATGVPENFAGAPGGFTAAQLPDGDVENDFLSLFGKPQRMEACECERDDGSNMLQSLYMINGATFLSRLTNPGGKVAALVKQMPEDKALIEQLYLWSLVRLPEQKELDVALEFFKSKEGKRDEAAQDLMWALLNSRNFLLVE